MCYAPLRVSNGRYAIGFGSEDGGSYIINWNAALLKLFQRTLPDWGVKE
jgi:hypothetical protein